MLVALGVSGGIAAYKACEVVRGLRTAGADVQVLMTRNAERFITPLTLQTLSGRRVLTDLFEPSGDETIRHIDLTREADVLSVAPATANVLGKFANGIADDCLSTFYTAVTGPVVVAPAMNTRMWLHPATQANVTALRSRGVVVVDPDTGWLAEGESGWGRLADPGRIVEATLRAGRRSRRLHGKTVLVTAGPTREPVDPVRFLSNRSSGKMGYAIASAAARRGADVVLVSGPVDRPHPYGVRVVNVETGAEMREEVLARRRAVDAIFMVAAVSDYAPRPAASKIKRSEPVLTLSLEECPDILAELGRDRGEALLVGFAAETENLVANARSKLLAKNVDFIVANDVASPHVGIGSDRNRVKILDRDGGVLDVPEATKGEVADAILDRVFGADES